MQLYLASGGGSIIGYSHGSIDALAIETVRLRVRNNDGEDIALRARVVLGWAGNPADPAGNWSTLHADTAGSMDPTGVAVGSWLDLGTFGHFTDVWLWERLAPPADATAGNHGYTVEFEVTPVTEPAYNLTYEFGATVINPTYKDGESTTVLADLTNFESDHPYPAGAATYTHLWTYTHPTAADSLDLTFDALTELEDGFDYLREVDSGGTMLREWTGSTLAGQTITFTGNVVRLRLDADDSTAAWGFRVSALTAGGASGTVEASGEASAHSLATTIEASATASAASQTPVETAGLAFARSLLHSLEVVGEASARSLAQVVATSQTGTVTTDESISLPPAVVMNEAGGVFLVTHTALIEGYASPVVLDYTWSSPPGSADSLTVTVEGEHENAREADISVTTVAVELGTGATYSWTYGPLPGTGECSVADGRTTLTARADGLQEAAQGSLGELVPWVREKKEAEEAGGATQPENPKSVPCNQLRDQPLPEISVHSVISLACPSLRRHGTGFSGESFQETRREYSTEGKSPLGVAQEILGTLNYEFAADRAGLHAYAPNYSFPVSAPPAARVTRRSSSITRSQYPHDVRASCAPLWVELPSILAGVTDAPDMESFLFETSPNQFLYYGEDTGGGNGTFGVIQKASGRIVGEVEVTLGDVTVSGRDVTLREFVTVTFPHVALSKTVTHHYYDEQCHDRLVGSIRTVTIYGYTVNTLLQVDGINLGGAGRNFMRGDIVGNEYQDTNKTWSPQGWLAQEVVTSDQIGSVAQEGVSTDTPGPLLAHTRKTTQMSTTHAAIGGGLWMHVTQGSGADFTPVWDDDFEDYVKLEMKTFKLPTTTRVDDQAPGQTRCAGECEQALTWVQDPQEYEASPGGPGGTVSFSWPWVKSGGSLGGYVTTALHALLPRKTTTLAYDVPWGAVRRGRITEGVIRSVTARGSAGSFSLEVTVEDASSAY
jgi:hypothetical protein